MTDVLTRFFLRGLLGLAVLACWAGIAGEAAAQFGLAEQGAVMDAQAEMAGAGRDPRRDPRQESETPDREDAADEPATEEATARPSGVDSWDDQHSIFRQKELSISWLKLVPVLLLLLLWVRSADWVNRDAQLFELGHDKWNAAMVAPFVVAFFVWLLVPLYPLGLSLMALAWLVPFVLYSVHHNKSVEPHETVFTQSWWRHQFAAFGKRLGMKVSAEKKADYMRGPQVDLSAHGGEDDRTNNANLLTARQSPGYVHVKELVADMVARGSNRVLMDYGAEAVGARYMIDGVWHNGDARDRESGDVMLAVMKQLAGLNVSERKKKQAGEFGAGYKKKKYHCEVVSQGVKTGERVVVSLRGGTMQSGFKELEQLGMREKLRGQVQEMMASERGVVLFSSMPEGGLTTLLDVSLLESDRLMRDFFAIEEASEPEADIENVQVTYYDAAQGESPAKHIPSLSRKYPNVWVLRDFVDEETAKLMMDEVDLDRLVITSVNAKDVSEACLRLLKNKTPHKEFVANVVGVVNVRLIRKLCTACRVEYEASPGMLKKLGIPPGKVSKLYRTPTAEEIPKPCIACAGLGYKERTGLFEVLAVDGQFREKLLKEPKIDVLRKAARAAGMRTLQEEGILLVAKGTTSLQELQRILKE